MEIKAGAAIIKLQDPGGAARLRKNVCVCFGFVASLTLPVVSVSSVAKKFPFGVLRILNAFKPIIYGSEGIKEIFFSFPFLIQKLPPHNLYKLPRIEMEEKGEAGIRILSPS